MRSFPPEAERGCRMTMSISRPRAVRSRNRRFERILVEVAAKEPRDVELGQAEQSRGLGLGDAALADDGVDAAVIGRDHMDSGSVASPNRETEGMRDGTDAVADWALLNALLNTASGATWVSIHHGGGVGIGDSQHAGMVVVADGTEAAARRLERVLWNDPASGVMRHADAGYDAALDCAREHGLNLPMIAPGR